MFAVQPMKNKKAHVYDSEVKLFRKQSKEKRKSRQAQRESKRNYQEGSED